MFGSGPNSFSMVQSAIMRAFQLPVGSKVPNHAVYMASKLGVVRMALGMHCILVLGPLGLAGIALGPVGCAV